MANDITSTAITAFTPPASNIGNPQTDGCPLGVVAVVVEVVVLAVHHDKQDVEKLEARKQEACEV